MNIKKIAVGLLQTNCYLLLDSGELAIIDPGNEAEKISKQITATGAKPKIIILTHSHFDHVGAVQELKKRYGIPVLIGEKEKNILGFVPDKFIKEAEELKIGSEPIKAIEAPGHTRGGLCFLGDGFAISGDTLFEEGIGRTDLEGGSNKELAVSLEKLDRLIPEGATVYPGHGREFSYQKGMALEWVQYLK